MRRGGEISVLAEMLAAPQLSGRRRLRSNILWILAESDNPIAVSALIDALRGDPGDDIRVSAAAALARRGELVAVEPVLIDALRDEDYRIRMHAARGLASVSSERAAAALVDALADPHTSVRWQVADSLGWIGIARPEVSGPLAAALEDRSRRVRLSASRSLSRMGARSALPAMRRARDRAWPPWRFALSKDIHSLEERFV